MNHAKPIYLLGAGASCDAGLPMSQDLTTKIGKLIAKTEPIEQSPYGYEPYMGLLTQAYYATLTLLEAGDAYIGRPPRQVDIERLFSAAQSLATVSSLEVAPFVQEWRQPFLLYSSPSEWKYFLQNIKNYDPLTWDAKINGAPPVPPTPSFQRIYGELCERICDALQAALTAHSPEDHSYLSSMFDASSTTRIATLNYDLGVEQAARGRGLDVDTGITKWRGGLRWRWSDPKANVQLLKLHGSLDWGQPVGEGGYLPPETPSIVTEDSDGYICDKRPNQLTHRTPGMIFGLRNKLRPDGPFMAMLNEFWQWLEEADKLVVIGYSFRDEHINSLILDWIHLGTGRTLEVVDPSIPRSWRKCTSATPWIIRSALDYKHHEAPGCLIYPQSWLEDKPCFIFRRQGAKGWLESL